MKINVIKEENPSGCKSNDHLASKDDIKFPSTFETPWISHIFDTLGLVSIALGVIAFIYSFFDLEDGWQPFLFISLFFSGFIYIAVAVILRAVSETAYNTKELVILKKLEHK